MPDLTDLIQPRSGHEVTVINWLLGKLRSLWPSQWPRRSPRWRAVRAEHLRTHNVCAACGTRKRLEVHHILPFHLYPEHELHPRNLITLCERDHLVFGHLADFRSYNVAVIQDCLNYRAKVQARPRGEESKK